MKPKRIGIIGGGSSAVIATTQILDKLEQYGQHCRAIITVFGQHHPGLGLAYATQEKEHLLNVRAGNMSGLAEQPYSFVDWLQSTVPDHGYTSESYVSRA